MTSLASVRIRNYRCFNDHSVDFGSTTIVVGRNNAGKSTLIEALRLVSVTLPRFKNPVAVSPPDWLDDYAPGHGQRLDLRRLGVSYETVFHRYGEAPAIIDARFDNNSQLTIFIGPEGHGHAVFVASDGSIIRRRRDVRAGLPIVSILPQTVPLEREERILSEEYVRENLDSNLASRHFRNQLNLLRDKYLNEFIELAERSWASIRIDGLEKLRTENSSILRLMIRDGDFVAEIGWMGHGLQMWLQTMWFITRTKESGTLVLDEPDVYMHPDLQRNLIRFLAKQNRQLIVATHSTEILAEVDATSVLILDRRRQRSSFAAGLPAVQRIIESMGSAQNLQIARLWRAKLMILVEGEDMKVLRRFHDLVNQNSPFSLDMLPNWPIGGWSGWSNALGSVTALQNSVHEDIQCYCILDSDYHLADEIRRRYTQADESGIRLHVLKRKEIENYLIVPSLVRRLIEKSANPLISVPSEMEISRCIDEICADLLPEVTDCFTTEFSRVDRGVTAGTAARRARDYVASLANNEEGRISIAPGKKVISALSAWSKREFDVSFGISSLLLAIRRDELCEEIVELVSAISQGRPISDRFR